MSWDRLIMWQNYMWKTMYKETKMQTLMHRFIIFIWIFLGLCGEECIKICRICDSENSIFKIFFGNENSEKAKFY